MNFADIVIAIPLLWAVYKGFRRGFIVELATLIGFWLGIWGSIHFSAYLVPVLKQYVSTDASWLPGAAFLLTFLIIILLIHLLARLVQKAAEGMALGLMNKLAGALFAFLKYVLLISTILYILNPYLPASQKKESFLYAPVSKVAPFIIPKLKELPLDKGIHLHDPSYIGDADEL